MTDEVREAMGDDGIHYWTEHIREHETYGDECDVMHALGEIDRLVTTLEAALDPEHDRLMHEVVEAWMDRNCMCKDWRTRDCGKHQPNPKEMEGCCFFIGADFCRTYRRFTDYEEE